MCFYEFNVNKIIIFTENFLFNSFIHEYNRVSELSVYTHIHEMFEYIKKEKNREIFHVWVAKCKNKTFFILGRKS